MAWVISAACALLLSACAAQTAGIDTARELFQQRRWQQAASAFAAIEKAQPNQTEARLYLAKCSINLGRYDEAGRELEAYLALHPQSDDAAYLIAYVRFRQDKPADSLHLYTAAARLKPPGADDLKIVALDYVLLNDYDDASRYLEMALRMDPDNLEARYHLGRVRYQQNRFDEAIAAFNEVLKHDPTSARAQDNLGLCLEAENKVEPAIAAYRKAIALDEVSGVHNAEPYLDLGILLVKSGTPEEGVTLLEKAVGIDPKSAKAHYQLAKAYFDLEKLAEAEHEAQRAVALDANNSSAHYLLGRIYHRVGRSDLEAKEFQITQRLLATSHHTGGMATGTVPQ